VVAAVRSKGRFLASSPTEDNNFRGVRALRDCITAAQPVYELLGVKGRSWRRTYPVCKHEFPEEVRKVAYEWLDRLVEVRRQRP